MSRCFPYPPPGYCRNGATYEALIESIKLQKENDKAKAERKKEKRAKKDKKEKKKKEKRVNDEKVKLQKKQSQDSHKLQKVTGFTEAQIKGTKSNTEILEKSDLTVEHGQPIKPSYSSDSTQNSNKRRRDDDVLLPDDSPSPGKPIMIRFLKKHIGSDSSISGEDARLTTVPLVPPSKSDRTPFVSSKRNNGVPATSGRDNNAIHGIPLTQIQSNTNLERTKVSNSTGLHLGREQSAPSSSAKPILSSGSRKHDAEVVKSSRQQQIASVVRPVVPQSHSEHEIPSSSASRTIGVQRPNSGRLQKGPSNLNPGIPDPVLNKPSPTTTGRRPINEIRVPDNSGPTKPEKKKEEDQQKVGPSRSEKKMLKKKAKYEKLIQSWVPPVFQAQLANVDDDEDWLSRRTKPAKSSISRGEAESCHELAATSLWQPRAWFLAEADMHALPYTVPF